MGTTCLLRLINIKEFASRVFFIMTAPLSGGFKRELDLSGRWISVEFGFKQDVGLSGGWISDGFKQRVNLSKWISADGFQ